jgi:hypothetical protein
VTRDAGSWRISKGFLTSFSRIFSRNFLLLAVIPTFFVIPPRHHERMETAGTFSPLEFAQLVWQVCAVARQCGLISPAFQDGPVGVGRHLRRRAGRPHEVMVVLPVRGRAQTDVANDVIEGVLVVNRGADSRAVEQFVEGVKRHVCAAVGDPWRPEHSVAA